MSLLMTTLEPAAIAELAVQALHAEALLTPKPGLVDRDGSGGHTDMNLDMLLRSADALSDTFVQLAIAGRETQDRHLLRDRVGALGRAGEAIMLDATGGINTHRGALWTLGLLVTAAASATSEPDIVYFAARLARTADSAGRPRSLSNGQRAVRRYGVVGAAGEASAGFPHITDVALPELRASRLRGTGEDTAQLRALLALIGSVDDTCILHRGSAEGLRWMQRTAARTLRSRHFDAAATRFARRADALRLSAGGSADLLAGAIFLDTLDRSPALAAHRLEASHAHL
jgi:triphosphoribosyl-dephospho-CoA synthase